MVLKKSDSRLEKGKKAPSFELENLEGETLTLEELEGEGYLVIFMCNHCPYVKAQIDEIRKLAEEFPSIQVIGINPNVETHPEDGGEGMIQLVEENGLGMENFYYLKDIDQSVAESYGAKCTPDPFLLDSEKNLYYHGRLNDRTSPEEDIGSREMTEVIQKMKEGGEAPEQKPSQGCSIKWKK